MDERDDNDVEVCRWFFRRCAKARVAMQTPLSSLELSLRVLHFVESIGGRNADHFEEEVDDNDDIAASSQLRLFNVLRDGCMAKRRHVSFVFDICNRLIELRDDDHFSEKTLRAIAAEEEEEDVVGAHDDGSRGQSSEIGNGTNAAAAIDALEMNAELTAASCVDLSETNYSGIDDVNFDELHCFKLRTKVLGLSFPTFTTELWGCLQLAGWTYSNGKYHIPKMNRQKKRSNDYIDMFKKIFEHFDLDDSREGATNYWDDDNEEGPEVFDGSNELVEYLDEYCMLDYRVTPVEVEATHLARAAKSIAYRRRNLRLRNELLEIAYRERKRRRQSRDEAVDNNNLHSKYGHNHRPCEICLKGANSMHPRVACSGCGLVVHTHCYGLLDHGEMNGSGRKGAEVDEMGFFTCDVCAMNATGGKPKVDKRRWEASQHSGWRVHHLPHTVCTLCGRKDIRGGMVRIVDHEEVSTTLNSRKRKGRGLEDLCETWVHLFCFNSMASIKKLSPYSIRKGGDAIARLRDALEKTVDIIRETESKRMITVRCETCANGKGDLVQCKGSCGKFYHRLCLQIDRLDIVGCEAKVEHFCLQCRSSNDLDAHVSRDNPIVKATIVDTHKANNPKVKSSKLANNGKYVEEVDQYFRRKPGKALKPIVVRSEIVMPSPQECTVAAEIIHRGDNVASEFDKFEDLHKQQFYEWSFLLATHQSVLLYGYGSKISLLSKFGNFLAEKDEGDVMSLNGYDPNFDLFASLESLDDLFPFGGESRQSEPTGLVKKASSIAKRIALSRSRPLFILIHNIDGVGLRTAEAQDSIATLTANSCKDGSPYMPLIRVVASIDNVNAAMVLWSPEVSQKFNWAWLLVHTYRPYFEEVRCMPHASSAKKVKKGYERRIISGDSAALKVLACLAPRHTEILQALASLQQRSSVSEAVSYGMLRDECTRKMLPSSDAILRNILRELSDHSICSLEKDERGNETVCVPSDIIPDILKFKIH